MTMLHTSAEATIESPASLVLTILRDFDGHHRRILPPAFSDLVVEEGGVGAGTVSRFRLTLGGRTQEARTRVEEPAPGVIVERVIGREMVTTFTVTPEAGGARTRIETDWAPSSGPAGLLERLLVPAMLRRIYRDELARLDAYAKTLS